MTFITRARDEDDCDCEPKWLQLALVVLPAVLPILFEKIADAAFDFFERKRESQDSDKKEKKPTSSEEEEDDDDES